MTSLYSTKQLTTTKSKRRRRRRKETTITILQAEAMMTLHAPGGVITIKNDDVTTPAHETVVASRYWNFFNTATLQAGGGRVFLHLVLRMNPNWALKSPHEGD